MIAILIVLGVLLATMAVKIKRMVWKEDKILPFVLFFMTASVIFYIFYFIVQVVVYSVPQWYELHEDSYTYFYMYTYYSAVLLLAIGAVLNLHKWI